MNIYLIRHAESFGNLSESIVKDSKLTSFGEEQAKRLAIHFKKLNIQKIFSSDIGRAISTTKTISKKVKKKVIYTKLIRERNMGRLLNQRREKIRKILSSHPQGEHYYRPISGESMIDVEKRASEFIQMLKREKSEDIAVVTHAGFIISFIIELFKLPQKERKFIQIKPASISKITFDSNFRVTNFILGDMSHLIKP